MAFARAKFGLEYNPAPPRDSESFPWLVLLAVVAVISAISFGAARYSRYRRQALEKPPATASGNEIAPETAAIAEPELPTAPPAPSLPDLGKRPAMVRNLLAKLEAAETNRDIEMAIDTIERLRKLPGSPAADLDDRLARRLGMLNLKKLYARKSREWVKEVEVKRGDNLIRISREHGATAKSTRKLNAMESDRLKTGQKLLVMNHPRFNLVVHGQPKYADLMFMGKFFKRYYLESAPATATGEGDLKAVPLKAADREELETLMPESATVLFSEF